MGYIVNSIDGESDGQLSNIGLRGYHGHLNSIALQLPTIARWMGQHDRLDPNVTRDCVYWKLSVS